MLQPLTLGPMHHGAFPEWAPELARQPFHFTPAIAGVRADEWTLLRIASEEMVAANTVTGQQLTVPRRYVDHVVGGRVMLTRRLEVHRERVRPADREVIPMPAPSDAPRVRLARPATVVAIREAGAETPVWVRRFRGIVAWGCLAGMLAMAFTRS